MIILRTQYIDSDQSDTINVTQISTLSDGQKIYYLNNNNQPYEEKAGSSQGSLQKYQWHLGGPNVGVLCWGNDQNQNNCATILSNVKHELSSL